MRGETGCSCFELDASLATKGVGTDVIGAQCGVGVHDGGVASLAGVGRAVGLAALGGLARVADALGPPGVSNGGQAVRAGDGAAVHLVLYNRHHVAHVHVDLVIVVVFKGEAVVVIGDEVPYKKASMGKKKSCLIDVN